MLAQENLGTNYRQSTSKKGLSFANATGWEYTPDPREITIQETEGNAKNYINEYVNYLREETGDNTITGSINLIT